MRNLVTIGFAVLVALSCAAPASAGLWVEVGDAGQLPGTAQQVVGVIPGDPLNTISGTISANNDVDLYRIFISSPAAFSATTSGQPGTLIDTQLFLFNDSGLGVEANDDVSFADLRSTMPAGSPVSPTVAGFYLLAISSFNNDPLAPGGLRIFPDPSGIGPAVGPTGPGGGLPLTGWTNTGGASGTYTIALNGAVLAVVPAVVPEPASLTLMGLGAVSLFGYGWRRRRQAI